MSNTRDRIVAAAEPLMLSKGYGATRVDEICELAGVSKGSFYHFFPTKEDLGLAVLEAFQRRNDEIVERGPQSTLEDPVDRALALVDHFVEVSNQLWGGGCLLGSFALELADTNPAMRQAVSALFEKVADGLARAMAPLAAEDPGVGRSGRELAERFIVVVEGALILAKAHKDWGYVTRALERFSRDVRAPLDSR